MRLNKRNGKETELKESAAGGHAISSGLFGKTQLVKFELGGRDVELVRKSQNFDHPETVPLTRAEVDRILDIHHTLRTSGIDTFTTLRSDGKAWYSTPLNRNGYVAVSANNAPPESAGGIDYSKDIAAYFASERASQDVKNLCARTHEMVARLSRAGIVCRNLDCWFMHIPVANMADEQGAPRLLVADFENVFKYPASENSCARGSYINAFLAISGVINRYCKDAQVRDELMKIVKDAFSPPLNTGEIFTIRGIKKHFKDYQESDGEAVLGNITIDENTSWEEIDSLSRINGLQLDLTRLAQPTKDRIENWAGSIRDGAAIVTYPNLRSIGYRIAIGRNAVLQAPKLDPERYVREDITRAR